MQRWKSILYNTSFGMNCMLVFLLIFESRISLPSWVQVIGRMHPLLLHFPIVLLVLCVFWELYTGTRKVVTTEQNAIGDNLLILTAFTSVTSALMGLLLSKEGGYTPESLVWHKWGGVFISLLSLSWFAFRQEVRKHKIAMSLTAGTGLIVVVITGHLGGDITHGDDFLMAPVNKEQLAPPVLFEDAFIYANMVQPILKAKCVACHNEKKTKGQLLMEPYTALLKGGKSGSLWDLNAENLGLLLTRVHLPMDNKKHMPPTGKTQLTEEEISILYHWIKRGASATTKVAALPESDSLRQIAAAVFKTVETDNYTFKPADESKIKALKNNYRFITPLSIGSPALGVEFFGAAQFKPEQLKELLEIKEQVVSLNLNKIPVSDDDLTIISQFINLRKLNLSFTNIKGATVPLLAKLTLLQQLSLSGTKVTAAQLLPLAVLPKLTELFIWNTPAQAESLAALQKKMKNTSIQTGFNGDTIRMRLNAPIIENEEQVILEPLDLKMKHYINGVTIRYTTDGTEPDSLTSPEYKGSFVVDKNMTLKAKAFKPGWISSDISEKIFYNAGQPIDSIRLLKPAPDQPYKDIKASVLADAQKGDLNFRSGKWIGFRGENMQAMIYFDTAKTVSSVTVSSVIDIGGYIMPPMQIEVWAGADEAHLKLIIKINPEQPAKEISGYLKGFELNFAATTAKCMKVTVMPVSKLPQWHRGKGDKGWAFVDEIFLN